MEGLRTQTLDRCVAQHGECRWIQKHVTLDTAAYCHSVNTKGKCERFMSKGEMR